MITDAVVAFALVSFLVAVVVVLVVVLLVFVLIPMIFVMSNKQNFTRLNCRHSGDCSASHQQDCSTANNKVFQHERPKAETLS